MSRLVDFIWRRFRVSTRIAGAMIVCLLTIQAFVVLQFLLGPERQMTLFGARWLLGVTAEAANAAFAQPMDGRNAVLRERNSEVLAFSWQTDRPRGLEGSAHGLPVLDRLEATLRQAMQAHVKSVRIIPRQGPGPRWHPHQVSTVGLDPANSQQPLTETEPDIPVPGDFRIVLEGRDGSWMTVTPHDQNAWQGRSFLAFLPLLGGTLVVAALSVFTARRILAPLNQLTHAAERLGIEREPVPISLEGLGEFSTIGTAFNDMQFRLMRFIDERTQMLAAISHDLRTSLTRLKLALESISDPEQTRELAKEIDEMEAMITATLSFAKGDAQGEASRTIDLASLLISLCDDAADRGAKVGYLGPDHARVSCQPMMMKRALGNLIDNAVKYGNEAVVQLSTTAISAIVRISDSGPGIPADKRMEAFAPFRRLETSRNRQTGGVGLGLTIARDAVHAHGGTIELTDGQQRGLVVTVTVPVESRLRAA